MIDQKPAPVRFQRRRAGADFKPLPASGRAHDLAMPTPIGQVRTAAQIDIAERSVAVIAGAAEHAVFALNLARKQHAVAIVGQKCVLQLVKSAKILRPSHADGRLPVHAVAPGKIIFPFQPGNPRVEPVILRHAAGK
ncbi:hypothetical protein SDC9_168822 [bioreactor metagenome]|uniref:Uncharacterized protein n=1 Tax=bioreactor metagenome TaxID=1076179 RepID=A0A645GC50_9ZZZZ